MIVGALRSTGEDGSSFVFFFLKIPKVGMGDKVGRKKL